MSNNDHPVWAIYDQYKTARLNVKYYSCRVAQVERKNFWLEIILAITAPSSALAGFWFFKTDAGGLLWQGLASFAAILSLVKPFLKLPNKIKYMEQALSGYRALECDLEEVVNRIRRDGKITDGAYKMFDAAQKRKKTLIGSSPEHQSDPVLIEKYTVQVNQELPSSSFFIPKE